MKFAAAAILTALGLVDASKSSALRNAIPVDRNGLARSLNDNGFQISADYSIVYNTCISLKVYDEDLFDENSGISAMAQQGIVVAENSYVLFNAVLTENLYYQSGSDENLYMLPVGDWFDAVSDDDKQEDSSEQMCQACWESYDVCYPEEAAAEDGADEADAEDAAAEDGGERKLYKKQRMTAATRAQRDSLAHIMGKRRLEQAACSITVDCDTCEAAGCFADDNGEQEQDNGDDGYCDQDNYVEGCTLSEESVQEFMQNAACVETDQVIQDDNGNEYQLRAGFICDPEGYGVQVAMFMNEECTVYNKNLNFEKMMYGTYTYALFEAAKTTIQQPYQQAIDCLLCQYAAIQQDDNVDNQNQAAEAQLNGICENVMNQALDVATCGGAEQQEDNQDAQQEQEDDGVDRSWYTADIGDSDNDHEVDVEDVCFFIQNHINELDNYRLYEGKNAEGGGGFFFDYDKHGSSNQKLRSAAKYIGIIAGVCLVVVAGVLVGQSFAKKDSKKVPLVGSKGGAMA
ncbi:hypothetical protein ACA910_008188 [Epithemia clementina (nom. ined.)]